MKPRILCLLAVLLGGMLLVGCETTEPAPTRDSTGDESGARSTDAPPLGGNVRSSPYYPGLPSEIERADHRYW
jgi:hypothetical protein